MKRQEGILNAHYQVEEANLKGYILYDFYYMTVWKRKNYGDIKQVSGCQELRAGGRSRWSTADF